MLKKLLPYMKNYINYAILSPIFMILEVFTDIGVPYLMSKIVDIGIANKDIQYVFKIGVLMVLVSLIGIVFGILSAHCGARAGYGFASEIRYETFKKVESFSFANLDKFSVSSLVTRLTNDCNTLGQVTMMSLRMGVRAPFMMIFALIMSIRINSSLAMIFAVVIPLTAVVITILLSKARPLFLEIQNKVDRVNSIIKENLAGIRVIKSFNRQDHEEKRFKERNTALRDTALEAISIIIFIMPILNLIIYGTIMAVLWYGGQMITVGELGSGELILFITYITQIMVALMMMSMFFMQLLRGIASKDRILEVWNTDSEIIEVDEPIFELSDGSVKFENVNFRYPGSKYNVLNDINLDIKSGEVVGIIGSTGSSKSTLVQLIPRLYDVVDGAVLVGGKNVKEYDIKALRDQVAFVLQKNTLFSGTIRENMQWGREDATDEEIIQILKQAQAWEFVSKYEDGLDHWVEQGGSNFSGGQKQRLTIARALIKNPKIIILDDSTSAVDMTTDAKIQKIFKEELTDVTTIIIGQRISSIKHADKILVMHEGRIESIGNHDTLLKESSVYREIYESQERGVVGQ
ncbi:MAG: ABC transporter ATP-binding protein [Clostridiales bacterium]|nr:ABC transporter ATP-binding protein [Clostridiales bacterium]